MRRDILYLTDIIDASDHIAAFISKIDFEAFQKSEMMRSAVVQKLAIIGEAAARISEPVRSRHPQLPWPQIVAFRNVLNRDRLGRGMASCQESLPALRKQVGEILASESGQ